MRQQQTKPFPYFIGIHSLEELVTRDSRVCVINILGNESRKVTPVSHAYSGGNVVAGVQYGRKGELETPVGPIPVYSSIRDVIQQRIFFDIGVIYLPPPAVSQAVAELVYYNQDLKRVVIVTEKVPARDSRNCRFVCQEAGVDIIGANCLGMANAWDHVRVGGALGGATGAAVGQKVGGTDGAVLGGGIGAAAGAAVGKNTTEDKPRIDTGMRRAEPVKAVPVPVVVRVEGNDGRYDRDRRDDRRDDRDWDKRTPPGHAYGHDKHHKHDKHRKHDRD